MTDWNVVGKADMNLSQQSEKVSHCTLLSEPLYQNSFVKVTMTLT